MIIYLIAAVAAFHFASELTIVYRKLSLKGSTQSKHDNFSLPFFFMMIPTSVIIGFLISWFLYDASINLFMLIPGLIISLMGPVIRWTAISQLKAAFTVDVAIVKGHSVKKDGLFKHLRHPSYLGLFLCYFGVGIALSNWISLVVISVCVFIAIYNRVRIEEKALIEAFGDEYIEYSKHTKKIFPFIY